MSRVTAKQIADAIGMSQPTVSLILNNKGSRYRTQTQERVWAAAREMGYRPNAAVHMLQTGRFNCAALLMGCEQSCNLLPQRLLEGLHDGLAEQGMHLMVVKMPDEKLTDETVLPRVLREWAVDGFLVNYNTLPPKAMVELIEQYQLPSIWINIKRDCDCVRPDDLAVGRMATEHLLALGHKRIAYTDCTFGFNERSPAKHYSATDRYKGYALAMREAGLALQFEHGDRLLEVEERMPFHRRYLSLPDRPTAVVANGQIHAVPLYAAALSLGLQIPQDLSIVMVAPERESSYDLNMTAVTVREYEEGREACRMFAQKLRHPSRTLPPRLIVPGFDAGGSCWNYTAG